MNNILTIMYDRVIMFVIEIPLFSLGWYLWFKAYKIQPKTVQKVCSVYNGVIFGSLVGFILFENVFFMAVGALILSAVFLAVDRYFKNDGMFSVTFICIFDCFYILVIGTLYHVSRILYAKVTTIDEDSFVYEHFDPVAQQEKVFLTAIIIALVVAVLIAKKVKKVSVLYFMTTLFGANLIVGAFLGDSYGIYPQAEVSYWMTVYLSILGLEYDRMTLTFFFIIMIVTLIVYFVQTHRKRHRMCSTHMDRE